MNEDLCLHFLLFFLSHQKILTRRHIVMWQGSFWNLVVRTVQQPRLCLWVVQLLWSDCVTLVGGRPWWLYQLQQVAHTGVGRGQEIKFGFSDKYWNFWWVVFFLFIAWLSETSLRMEIKIKLLWLFVTWKNICFDDMLEYVEEKKIWAVQFSHGCGGEEWYTGNNVYQDLVGNNWEIMRSVTSV